MLKPQIEISLAIPICSTRKRSHGFLANAFVEARLFNIYLAYHIQLYAFIFKSYHVIICARCNEL